MSRPLPTGLCPSLSLIPGGGAAGDSCGSFHRLCSSVAASCLAPALPNPPSLPKVLGLVLRQLGDAPGPGAGGKGPLLFPFKEWVWFMLLREGPWVTPDVVMKNRLCGFPEVASDSPSGCGGRRWIRRGRSLYKMPHIPLLRVEVMEWWWPSGDQMLRPRGWTPDLPHPGAAGIHSGGSRGSYKSPQFNK